MKQQVLKALANPAHIFYVPYSLAVINFVVQFLIYGLVFGVTSVLLPLGNQPSPLWFLASVVLVHSIIAIFSRRDPQLGQIISAKIQLIKYKIPRRLAA